VTDNRSEVAGTVQVAVTKLIALRSRVQYWAHALNTTANCARQGPYYCPTCGQTSAQFTRSYDAESHLLNQIDGSGNLQMKRTYGPDGHID